MKQYGLNELREMFLSFFETKGHLRLPSFSLIPQNDASLLIINSGMITGHAVANARGVRRHHPPLHCAALAVSLDCRMRLLV